MPIVLLLISTRVAAALDESIPRIEADYSRVQLGDGTGVVVGIVDSGMDDLHPALAGNDSLGMPRFVAEANFVPTEPGNSGDDVFGHGTAVGGVALSSDARYTGLAPDARFVNARVLDSGNGFQTADWVINGMGFALAQGADVLNMSLNLFSGTSTGGTKLDMAADWVAYETGVPLAVCAGNISQASGGSTAPRAPGAAFNVLSVGRTTRNFTPTYARVDGDSAFGPTSNGRGKPDIVAPGNNITTLSDDWEQSPDPGDDFRTQAGCSFATPHVAGMLAQQIEYGRTHALSVDPLVLKSTLLNSAEKVYDRNGASWAPQAASQMDGVWNITSPLDSDSGAGQINGRALFEQYSAGQHRPGESSEIGWDINTITGTNQLDYQLAGIVRPGSLIATTLSWSRHIDHLDTNGNQRLDASDGFLASATLDNLDLTLLRDGLPVVRSVSTVDNLEHIFWSVLETGNYSVRVTRNAVPGSGEDELFALAWRILPPLEPVHGDTNGDDLVDLVDLNAVRNNFGLTGDPIAGDTYPFDGVVGLYDLNEVRNNFGFVPTFRSVPEPGGIGIGVLALGLIAISAAARRRAGHGPILS